MDGETAIVPIIIGDDEKCFSIWRMLYDEGIFVNAFISPATPPGMAMLRTSYMATHEEEHLAKIVTVLKSLEKNLGCSTGKFRSLKQHHYGKTASISLRTSSQW